MHFFSGGLLGDNFPWACGETSIIEKVVQFPGWSKQPMSCWHWSLKHHMVRAARRGRHRARPGAHLGGAGRHPRLNRGSTTGAGPLSAGMKAGGLNRPAYGCSHSLLAWRSILRCYKPFSASGMCWPCQSLHWVYAQQAPDRGLATRPSGKVAAAVEFCRHNIEELRFYGWCEPSFSLPLLPRKAVCVMHYHRRFASGPEILIYYQLWYAQYQ